MPSLNQNYIIKTFSKIWSSLNKEKKDSNINLHHEHVVFFQKINTGNDSFNKNYITTKRLKMHLAFKMKTVWERNHVYNYLLKFANQFLSNNSKFL
jgi:hypothetical protein